MKNTTNVFLKGMTSDMHPLTTSQLEYTDALNATLVTFNGNEQMMLNDMGNTKIQDSKTGNLMGLREGFIPVGLKEHGGIMYIASVNKEGEGEIGTIPSPVIRYNKKDEFTIDQLLLNIDPDKGYGDLVKLTEYPLKAGDKFVVFLPLDNTSSGDASFDCPDSNNLITTPIIENNTNYGIYRIGLYSQADGQVYDLNDLVDGLSFSFLLRDASNNSVILNNRWFVDLSDLTLDTDAAFVNENSETRENSSFIMYPRISSGYPSVRLEINRLDSFSLLPNHTSTTDDNRRYPFTIFDDSDPNNQKYITYIRGFEYITTSGIHPTKLKINLVSDSIEEPLIENKELEFESGIDPIYRTPVNNDASKFRIAFKPDENYSNLNNDYYNTNTTGISVPIGQNSNVWFTLTVDYYYTDNGTDIKLGTYTCRYNPYVYDTLKNFRLVKFVVNENYNGEGNIWFLLYYDIKLRFATNLERTFSKLFVSEGGSRKYYEGWRKTGAPSGCGVNQIEHLVQVSGQNQDIPIVMYGYENTDITDQTSTSDLDVYEFDLDTKYRCFFEKDEENTRYASFYRSGVRMSNLGIDKTEIKDITDFADNTGDSEKYLYVNSILKDFNSNILLSYDFNNLGFRIVGDDFDPDNTGAHWDDDVIIKLACMPISKLYEIERKHWYRDQDENYPNVGAFNNISRKCVIGIFAPQSSYITLKSELSFEKFKEYLDHDYPIFTLRGYAATDDSKYDLEIYWLSGDPSQTKDGYSNNSILTLDVNLSTKLNITGISDYQVIPQVNVVYEEDGQVYPGYLNGSIIEEIDVDITKNYFLKNGISEGAYVLNTSYHSFEDTSIYGAGFGYNELSKINNNLNIELNPGVYVIHFNIFDDDKDNTNNNWYIIFQTTNSGRVRDLTSARIDNTLDTYVFEVLDTKSIFLTGVTVGTYGLPNTSLPKFTSCGLYRASKNYEDYIKDQNNTFKNPKFQTVYTYSEDGKSCLGKPYSYSGGSAFCGYLKSEDVYELEDLHDNKITYNDTEIEVRRCLAPQ